VASLSKSELVRLLRRNGCTKIRDGAKHEIWFSHISNLHFSVPRTLRGEGTLRHILKDSGIKR